MDPLRYIKALFGLGDVDAFWMAREEILKSPGKHCLENYLCKIIRKHYGAYFAGYQPLCNATWLLRDFHLTESESRRGLCDLPAGYDWLE